MRDFIERQILPKVTKPTRYIGNELNSIHKDWAAVDVHIAFAFPDVYEVGMSHLGTKILYHIANQRTDTLLERVFAPWVDMEVQMREKEIPLFSLESYQPVSLFDIFAFTLQYEMSFSNIINMLDLAKIPLRAKDRTAAQPLVIAGGPCAYNPEPLADIIDLFVIGEGEEVFNEIIDAYKQWHQLDKVELLKKMAAIPGVYVPLFYNVQYNDQGRILAISAEENALVRVDKRIVKNFDQVDFPTKPIVPYMDIVHNRIMLEVLRGCMRGCRFCQAGVLYRPVREKSPDTLFRQADELVKNTGYDDISLTSLSTSDYSCVQEVLGKLLDKYSAKKIGISLPSLRVDSFSVDLAKEVQKVRRTSLTFAPEAGTQRLRDVINKGVTEENLMSSTGAAFSAGWSAVKLYFMIGLPTETETDLEGIAEMTKKVLKMGLSKTRNAGRLKVTASASSFVPKAHTPFQWEPQASIEQLKEKQDYLRNKIRDRKINFNWHDAELSFIEAVFARGDRRLADVLIKAWQLGCKFDGWSEHFHFDRWMQAFAECGIKPEDYANRRYAYEELLPWEHIYSGVTKEYLINEHKKSLAGEVTTDCRLDSCNVCGVCPEFETELDLKGGDQLCV